MPRQERKRSKSGYYHIMLRGNERRNIFLDDEDKLRFLETIYEKQQKDRFNMHAYCLMDNHVHLMIGEGTEDIAKVMKRITVSYVYYFNKKYKRVGHLFQDRYRSEVVEKDSYVLALARYIHQNPVKANMTKQAGEYKWSSYGSYIDEKNYFCKMIDRDIIMELFSEDREKAKRLFIKYMDEENCDTFIDLKEEEEVMEEGEAKALYLGMLRDKGLDSEDGMKMQVPDELIKEFREKTKFSIRKIVAITKLNKDKINKILKND